jgi:hypothetical protein
LFSGIALARLSWRLFCPVAPCNVAWRYLVSFRCDAEFGLLSAASDIEYDVSIFADNDIHLTATIRFEAIQTMPASSYCETSLRRLARKRNLAIRVRQNNPTGKSPESLSSPSAKNIPLSPSSKSVL